MNAPAKVPSQSKVLRRLYLGLFLRGRGSRGWTKETRPKSIASRLGGVLLLYALVGIVAVGFFRQPLFGLSLYLHGANLFFLGSFIASSIGDVLFNKDEAEILLHRPVTPKAMLWAKISMLLQVSLSLAIAFNLAGLATGTFSEKGSFWFAPAHLISTALSALFCTGSVVLIYQLCLRWFGRERLDGMMTFAQILMTLTIVLGGQIAPRLMRYLPENIELNAKTWWLALLPPAWFAGLDEVLTGRGNIASWCLAATGIGVTGGLMFLAFGKLADSFGHGLQTLGESQGHQPAGGGTRRVLHRIVAAPPLCWLLRDPLERAGFLLVAAYMSRDRDVKLRLYPGIASIMVMPFIFLFGGIGASGNFGAVFAGAYLGMIPLLALNLLQYSQHWQAGDVFRVTPLAGPAPLLIGGRKAVNLFLMLPGIGVLAICVYFLAGGFQNLILLLPGMIAVPVYSRFPGMKAESLPLSSPGEQAKAAGRGLSMIGVMVSSMVLAGLALGAKHYGHLATFLIGELILAALLCLAMEKRTRALPWPSVE